MLLIFSVFFMFSSLSKVRSLEVEQIGNREMTPFTTLLSNRNIEKGTLYWKIIWSYEIPFFVSCIYIHGTLYNAFSIFYPVNVLNLCVLDQVWSVYHAIHNELESFPIDFWPKRRACRHSITIYGLQKQG